MDQRYIGIQSELKAEARELAKIGDYGCLFLCMCSIAAEYNDKAKNGRKSDILMNFLNWRGEGWLGEDFLCVNQEKMLASATGAKWKKEVLKELPSPVPENMFTVEKWVNERTGYMHFRRRWGDTLLDSVTVAEGRLAGYYCYTVKEFQAI